ncbi:MAG: CDP-alcohol phosphatidyltransferase family protein [Acidimicrobiales bacterium]|jgi:CDP-diacylglycerol--glycerol-3-phosphate 3-phosphatidyltransferase|nr:CDP-alcohol phosphatidyltransferase family protein [Acidimicrobiales bacterium]
MLDRRFRTNIERGLRPVGQNLKRTGVTADHLTLAGVVMALGGAVAIGAGNLPLGLFFLVLAAVPDALDGAVAKASGTASPRGSFFDSVADRVSDALLFGGVAWYFAADDRGLLVMLPVAVLGASMLISYERAKADALGFDAKVGIMERAERLILLGLGLLFEALLVPVLVVMLVLTLVTAGQRFATVWAQASIERPDPRARRRTARRRARASRAQLRGAGGGTWRTRVAESRRRIGRE